MQLYKKIYYQFLSYAGVGAIGTAAQYVTLIVLVELFYFKPVTGSVCGFIVGALINYLLNYFITFRSNKNYMTTMVRFFCVALSGLFINLLIMMLATETFPLNYIAAQIVATGVVLVWGFFINKYWTFGGKNETRT